MWIVYLFCEASTILHVFTFQIYPNFMYPQYECMPKVFFYKYYLFFFIKHLLKMILNNYIYKISGGNSNSSLWMLKEDIVYRYKFELFYGDWHET
jgi:hypothetical protein